jgi:PAS domain S-box-containing protein
VERRQIIHACLFSAAYFVAALLGLQFASFSGVASTFWPAAGIALAALFFLGAGWWPAISVASLLAFLVAGTEHGFLGNLLLASGNGVAAAITAHLMRRARLRPDLSRFSDVVFMTFAAVAAAALAASFGVAVLSALVDVSSRSIAQVWIAWLLGDFGGIIVATPLVLAWRHRPQWRISHWAHLAACLFVICALSWIVFLEHSAWRTWHIFPVLVWAGLAFRSRGVSLAIALVVVFAIAGLANSTGPFVEIDEYGPPIVFMQQFIAIATITMLMLSAVADERHGARELADARQRLSIIVDSAMDGIVTVDRQGRILLFNPAAERIFGCSADEAIGASIERFVPERFGAIHAAKMHDGAQIRVNARKPDELGTLTGVRANGEQFPFEASISHVDAGGEQLSTVILRDVSKRVATEQARDLLAREVDHRAKNALAVAQAIVALTKAETKQAYVEAVRGRISALARAHSLLAKAKWEGADVATLIEEELRPYGKSTGWSIHGPAAFLSANAVQPFGLVIHELATNACKYGALCAQEGCVDVSWEWIENQQLRIRWAELHGPPVAAPQALGFGSTLLREVMTRQLGGTIEKEWRREGMIAELVLPADVVRVTTSSAAGAAADIDEPAPAMPTRAGDIPRALIVEDEALVGLEFADALREAGWEVLGPVSSIESGLSLAEKAELAVAVLDVNIHGKLIYPVADLLSQRGIPIVFCTGYQDFAPTGYEHARVIRKPVRTDELISAVNRVSRRAA